MRLVRIRHRREITAATPQLLLRSPTVQPEPATGTLRIALAHRDFRRLLAAMAVSGAGDWLYVSALTAFVLSVTGSAGWIAAVTALRFLPHLLLGPIGGVLADRFSTRRVMLTADGARVVLMLALAVAARAGWLHAALALAFLATAVGVAYSPAVAATTPALVGERDLAAANSAIRVVDHLAVAVGPALGSLVMVAGSPDIAFFANALTFVASAVLISGLRGGVRRDPTKEGPSLLVQLREGVHALRDAEGVSVLLGPFAAVAFTVGQAFVLLPLVSQRILGTGTDGVGFLFAAVGVGGMGAVAATGRLGNARHPGRVLFAAVTVSSSALMIMGGVDRPATAYTLLAVIGACNIILNVVAITLIQRVLPTNVIGRVFGILNAVAVAGLGAGSLIAPFVVNGLGIRTAMVVAGATVLALTLPSGRRLGALETRSAAVRNKLEPLVNVLVRLPVFAGAPAAAVELIARHLDEQPVASGLAVIREGEEPRDFYVVKSGRFRVTSTGAGGDGTGYVRDLEKGDHFGEIGLLEGIPRTATVTATSPGSVYRIPGKVFLEAVTAAPAFGATLMSTATTRLARTHPQRFGGDEGSATREVV